MGWLHAKKHQRGNQRNNRHSVWNSWTWHHTPLVTKTRKRTMKNSWTLLWERRGPANSGYVSLSLSLSLSLSHTHTHALIDSKGHTVFLWSTHTHRRTFKTAKAQTHYSLFWRSVSITKGLEVKGEALLTGGDVCVYLLAHIHIKTLFSSCLLHET